LAEGRAVRIFEDVPPVVFGNQEITLTQLGVPSVYPRRRDLTLGVMMTAAQYDCGLPSLVELTRRGRDSILLEDIAFSVSALVQTHCDFPPGICMTRMDEYLAIAHAVESTELGRLTARILRVLAQGGYDPIGLGNLANVSRPSVLTLGASNLTSLPVDPALISGVVGKHKYYGVDNTMHPLTLCREGRIFATRIPEHLWRRSFAVSTGAQADYIPATYDMLRVAGFEIGEDGELRIRTTTLNGDVEHVFGLPFKRIASLELDPLPTPVFI